MTSQGFLFFLVFLFVFLHVFPRDPGSPSENGFMEPKYHSFRRWLYTPCSSSDMVIGSLGILTYVYIYTHHLVGSLHHSLNFHPKTNIFEKIAHSVEMVPLQMALQTGKTGVITPWGGVIILLLTANWRIIPFSKRLITMLSKAHPLPNGILMAYKWGLLTISKDGHHFFGRAFDHFLAAFWGEIFCSRSCGRCFCWGVGAIFDSSSVWGEHISNCSIYLYRSNYMETWDCTRPSKLHLNYMFNKSYSIWFPRGFLNHHSVSPVSWYSDTLKF